MNRDAAINLLTALLLLGAAAAIVNGPVWRPSNEPEPCDLLPEGEKMSGVSNKSRQNLTPTPADPPLTHWYRWSQMKDAQAVTGKPAYVLASDTSWCVPCMTLRDEVFTDPEVHRTLRRFVCVKLEPHEFDPWRFQNIPRAAFVRPDGTIAKRAACPLTPDKYITHLLDGYNAANPPQQGNLTREAQSTVRAADADDRRRG